VPKGPAGAPLRYPPAAPCCTLRRYPCGTPGGRVLPDEAHGFLELHGATPRRAPGRRAASQPVRPGSAPPLSSRCGPPFSRSFQNDTEGAQLPGSSPVEAPAPGYAPPYPLPLPLPHPPPLPLPRRRAPVGPLPPPRAGGTVGLTGGNPKPGAEVCREVPAWSL